MLGCSAGINEGLCDHGKDGIHAIRHLHVKDKLRILQDVDPETQRQTVRQREDKSAFKLTFNITNIET